MRTASRRLGCCDVATGDSERLSAEQVAGLVSAAVAGKERAWDALVREFTGMVWAVARSHRLSDADAADAVQATWLKLLEHLDRLTDRRRVGPWLATTVRRECLRILRTTRRHVPFGEEAPEPPSQDAPPHEGLLIAERDQALWRSFDRLRDGDRALLRLLMTEPRPAYDEISAALDMPIGSIGPTRARALERLRRELDSQGALALMSA